MPLHVPDDDDEIQQEGAVGQPAPGLDVQDPAAARDEQIRNNIERMNLIRAQLAQNVVPVDAMNMQRRGIPPGAE
jgi:hypothetical protein